MTASFCWFEGHFDYVPRCYSFVVSGLVTAISGLRNIRVRIQVVSKQGRFVIRKIRCRKSLRESLGDLNKAWFPTHEQWSRE